MQTTIRLNLCLFSFDDQNDVYQDKKDLLERCEKSCGAAIRQYNPTGTSIAYIPYDMPNSLYLSAIGYKSHVFYGFYNSKTNKISFEDNKDQLINLNDRYVEKLEQRFKNEVMRPSHIQPGNILSAWEKAFSLLNSYIEIEKNVENMPLKTRERIKHTLKYDEQIDEIVKAYETSAFNNFEEDYDESISYT